MSYAEPSQNRSPSRAGAREHAHEGGTEEVNGGQLRAFVERAERLNEEKAALNDDLKELYAEVRSNGFDVPTIKEILKIRAQDPEKRAEKESILDVYLAALQQG